MTLNIDVTEDDIRLGKRDDCGACPIALAGDRALIQGGAGHLKVDVGYGMIFVTDRHADKYIFMDMPVSVLDFVEAFDARRKVRPFSFAIDLPDHFLASRAA